MKLFYLTDAKHALLDIALRRIKVSRFDDLNDPFELMPINVKNKVVRKAVLETRAELCRNRGLICFSKTWSNTVLWAHYGDKHKGMALGFNVPDVLTVPVTYNADLLRISKDSLSGTPSLSQKFGRELLSTKFVDWKYEEELRVFVNLDECEREGGLFFIPFDANLNLVEVVLGVRCVISPSRLRGMLETYDHDVAVRKAEIEFTKYGVTENLAGRLR